MKYKIGDNVTVKGIKSYNDRVGVITAILIGGCSIEVRFKNQEVEHFHPNTLNKFLGTCEHPLGCYSEAIYEFEQGNLCMTCADELCGDLVCK